MCYPLRMSELFAMSVFALALSASPGPVNVITLSIGMNHGRGAALPFVSGASIGFTLLLFLIGLGLAQIAGQAGDVLRWLNYAGLGYIFYLGARIARAGGDISTQPRPVPGFWQGFVLQWLNPKAWGASLAGIAAFNVVGSDEKLLVFSGLYLVICFVGVGSWALLGQGVGQMLTTPRALRVFNVIIGAGLMLVALGLLLSGF